MQDSGDSGQLEALQKKVAAQKQAAFEAELRRLDADVGKRAQDALHAQRSKRDQTFQEKLRQAKDQRQRDEEGLRQREAELRQKFDEEGRKRVEARRREEEALRKKLEEEQRRQEEERRRQALEEERRRKEEEARLKAEEQRRKQEEELRRLEEERRRKEEELRRLEEERRRRQEDEKRRQDEEKRLREEERAQQEKDKQDRFRSLVSNARMYYDSGDLERALVEIAKARVNDPSNEEAQELEATIKTAQGKPVVEEVVVAKREAPKAVRPKKKSTQLAPPRKRVSRMLIAAIIVGAVVLGILIVSQLRKTTVPPPPSLAVMPWTSASNSVEEKVLGSALAEEVARRFEYVKPLVLLGYGSSYQTSQHAPDPRRAIFNLGYLYVLEGTVARNGENVVVRVQLVDSLGNTPWSRRYEKLSAMLGGLPGEVAQQIAEYLGIASSELKPAFLASNGTIPPEAYSFYLRGLELAHRKTAASTANAEDLFAQAAQQYPKFANTLAAAANVLITEYQQGWNDDDSLLTQARRYAEAAVDADPGLSASYYALARVLAQNKQFGEALSNLDACINLAPNNSAALLERGRIYLRLGKYPQAMEAFQKGLQIDPRNPELLETLALALQLTGKYREGLGYHKLALSLSDDSTEYLVGPFADAVSGDPELRLTYNAMVTEACERRIALNPDDYHSMYQLARLRQLLGEAGPSNTLLKKLETTLQALGRQQPRDTRAMMYLALTRTRLGRFADAISLAQRAADIAPHDVTVRYMTAQMYTLQMKRGVDDKRKATALKSLQQAIAMSFNLEQLTSPDFFNLFDQPDFRTAIQASMQ